MKCSDELTGADVVVIDDNQFIKGTGETQDVLQDIKIWPTIFKEIVGYRGAYEQARWLLSNVDWREVKEVHGHYEGYSKEDFKELLDRLSEIKERFLLSSYPSEILSEYSQRNG